MLLCSFSILICFSFETSAFSPASCDPVFSLRRRVALPERRGAVVCFYFLSYRFSFCCKFPNLVRDTACLLILFSFTRGYHYHLLSITSIVRRLTQNSISNTIVCERQDAGIFLATLRGYEQYNQCYCNSFKFNILLNLVRTVVR